MMKKVAKLAVVGAVVSLGLVGCKSTSNIVLMPMSDGSYTVVGTAPTKFDAQYLVTSKAKEFCNGEGNYIISDTKSTYHGTLPEEVARVSGQGTDKDYHVSITFTCKKAE